MSVPAARWLLTGKTPLAICWEQGWGYGTGPLPWGRRCLGWAWGEQQACERVSLDSHRCESSDSVCWTLRNYITPVDLIYTNSCPSRMSSPGNCSSPTIAVLKNDHKVIQSLQCCTRKLAISCGRNWAGHDGAGLIIRGYWDSVMLLGWRMVVVKCTDNYCHTSRIGRSAEVQRNFFLHVHKLMQTAVMAGQNLARFSCMWVK